MRLFGQFKIILAMYIKVQWSKFDSRRHCTYEKKEQVVVKSIYIVIKTNSGVRPIMVKSTSSFVHCCASASSFSFWPTLWKIVCWI